MNCRTCDYPLWNMVARACPECGTPFKPSERDFLVNSVRFCCPHCDQAYFGTDAHGHLSPRAFDCVRCGRAVDMDEMILRPAEDLGRRSPMLARMPWLERQGKGAIKAWFATIGLAMGRPQDLMRGVPAESPIMSAWLFMIVTNLIFRILPLILAVITIGAIMGAMMGGTAPGGATRMIVMQALGPQGGALAGLAVLPVLWILVTHGLLRMTGPLEHGVARTWQAICYSSGANALAAVPCGACTGMAGAIWWCISATTMVSVGHGVSSGRAVFATLTGGAVAGVVAVGGYLVMLGGLGAFGPMAGMASTPADAAQLAQAITADAATRGGAGPQHAALLLMRDGASSWDFVTADGNFDPSSVPFGGGVLTDLDMLEPGRRRAAIDAVAGAMPAGVVAHRLGDYVFTYHGADLANADPALWIVVMVPDPDAGGAAWPGRLVHVGRADGTAFSVPAAQLPDLLRQQNELRAACGLAPLPDPATVTHGAPAVAPGAAGGPG